MTTVSGSVVADAEMIERAKALIATGEDQLEAAYADFLTGYPNPADEARLMQLRQRDYGRLDEMGQIYLDYTGGGLYGRTQIERHMQLLLSGVYGNPHSSNPTSMAATKLEQAARAAVLDFFHADPDEYVVIFTSNASGALHIIGESYPFEANGHYLLTFDNHNSVNGIREYARKAGATVTYVPLTRPDLRVDDSALRTYLSQALPDGNNLFSYPAQSNFTGVQHPLDWVSSAQAQGWDVLLDCAAYVPTSQLDLSTVKPDYISISFYKMFGYPTGIGALIARREKLKKLRKPWFAGGTITIASVQADTYTLQEGNAAFEDGTIDYLNIPAVTIGLEHLQSIGMETINAHVMALTDYLLRELTALQHENGRPLVKLYGPANTNCRAGTLAFNLFDPDGTIFDYKLVESLANSVNISVRTGCFCNPGAGELALNIQQDDLKSYFAEQDLKTFEQFAMAVVADSKAEAAGAVRVSVGLVTSFQDVYTCVQLLKTFLNRQSAGFIWTESDC